MGRRNWRTVGSIFIELVAQRTDRDAENVCGMGTVAKAVLERLKDQVALDFGHCAANQIAGDLFGGHSRMGGNVGAVRLAEPRAIWRQNVVDTNFRAGRESHQLHPALMISVLVTLDFTLQSARFAQFKVSVRLIPPADCTKEIRGRGKEITGALAPAFTSRRGKSLLAVLLNARRAQAGEAVLVDRVLPGQEFLDRKGITRAGFLK